MQEEQDEDVLAVDPEQVIDILQEFFKRRDDSIKNVDTIPTSHFYFS